MALIWKKGYFDLLFTFLVAKGKVTKIPSAHISLTCILLILLIFFFFFFFLPYQFWKKKTKNELIRFIRFIWFLFGVIPGVLIRAILEQSINNKIVSKNFKLDVYYWCIYTNAKFIVICKPRTLNDGGEDSVKYKNRKKHCFLAAAILLFIDKIITTW